MKFYFHPWYREAGCLQCGFRTDEWHHRPELCQRIAEACRTQSGACTECGAKLPPGDDRVGIQYPGMGVYMCGACDVKGMALRNIADMMAHVKEPPQPGHRQGPVEIPAGTTFGRGDVTDGQYLYHRPGWNKAIPVQIQKTGEEREVLFLRKYPAAIATIPEDAIFTRVA